MLTNSILWGNEAEVLGSEILINSGFGITKTFKLISRTVGVSDDSPFERDPSPGPDQIWGTADDDLGVLRPRQISQATDAGSNDFILADILDLDGDVDTIELLPVDMNNHPRIYNDTIDIGAYEWNRFLIYIPFIE